MSVVIITAESGAVIIPLTNFVPQRLAPEEKNSMTVVILK
jgi:hypothetical protein